MIFNPRDRGTGSNGTVEKLRGNCFAKFVPLAGPRCRFTSIVFGDLRFVSDHCRGDRHTRSFPLVRATFRLFGTLVIGSGWHGILLLAISITKRGWSRVKSYDSARGWKLGGYRGNRVAGYEGESTRVSVGIIDRVKPMRGWIKRVDV